MLGYRNALNACWSQVSNLFKAWCFGVFGSKTKLGFNWWITVSKIWSDVSWSAVFFGYVTLGIGILYAALVGICNMEFSWFLGLLCTLGGSLCTLGSCTVFYNGGVLVLGLCDWPMFLFDWLVVVLESSDVPLFSFLSLAWEWKFSLEWLVAKARYWWLIYSGFVQYLIMYFLSYRQFVSKVKMQSD